jgi:hypothetical protein
MQDKATIRLALTLLVPVMLVALTAPGPVGAAAPAEGPGTASAPASGAAAAAAEESPPATEEAMSEEERALRKRVHARWDAVLAMDFDRVYEFATPEYRKTYSKAHFFGQYGGQIKRNKIEILKVEFLDEARTEALVHIDIYYMLVPDFGAPFEDTAFHKEAWVKVDGEWWRVEPR